MAYHNSVLSQLLKLLPRHEFERRANIYDGTDSKNKAHVARFEQVSGTE